MLEVQQGTAAAHAIIYNPRLANSMAEVGKAADEVASIVHDARSRRNGINQLVYGDARGHVQRPRREAARICASSPGAFARARARWGR